MYTDPECRRGNREIEIVAPEDTGGKRERNEYGSQIHNTLLGLFHIAASTRRRVLAESTRRRVLAASTFRIDASEFKAGNTLCVIFCCCTYYCLVFVGRVT